VSATGVPEHVYAKWSSTQESDAASELGFRVHNRMVEFVDSHDEITSVRPANATEQEMWTLLMRVLNERDDLRYG
jgi:hypothetical protein